jgi:hypothetical protein
VLALLSQAGKSGRLVSFVRELFLQINEELPILRTCPILFALTGYRMPSYWTRTRRPLFEGRIFSPTESQTSTNTHGLRMGLARAPECWPRSTRFTDYGRLRLRMGWNKRNDKDQGIKLDQQAAFFSSAAAVKSAMRGSKIKLMRPNL